VNVESKDFVSIIDKAMLRKKAINEGSAMPPARRGELSADDLLAVAAEDDAPMPIDDVQQLAQACDIQLSALNLETAGSP
jgi:hypothetical protein